ncbi:MAG: hypothetical protein NT179_11395 [Nitrospirae bacterium]|nr:hypothetical protein [Nitrospirota bacterium]
MPGSFPWSKIALAATLLLCLGCAGPPIISRPVQTEPSWFVRLDSYQETSPSSDHRYDHPATWTTEELSAILSRLLLEEQRGILDTAKPPRPVFSQEDINRLAPAIQNAFRTARPHEWLSFHLTEPSGNAITSGGLFIKNGRLHIILANHQEPGSAENPDVKMVSANPLRSMRGTRGSLQFESPRFTMGTEPNWSGGHAASASELVLDHQAFLAFLRLPIASPPQPTASMPKAPQSENASPSNTVTSKKEPSQKDPLLTLQKEVDRLKQKIEDQEREIAKLKQSAGQPLPPRTRPTKPKTRP